MLHDENLTDLKIYADAASMRTRTSTAHERIHRRPNRATQR
jgi:hypothetical protein